MQKSKKSELKRLSRAFRDAVANLAIEGMLLSREDKAEIWSIYRMGISSDEMVEIFKNNKMLKK